MVRAMAGVRLGSGALQTPHLATHVVGEHIPSDSWSRDSTRREGRVSEGGSLRESWRRPQLHGGPDPPCRPCEEAGHKRLMTLGAPQAPRPGMGAISTEARGWTGRAASACLVLSKAQHRTQNSWALPAPGLPTVKERRSWEHGAHGLHKCLRDASYYCHRPPVIDENMESQRG